METLELIRYWQEHNPLFESDFRDYITILLEESSQEMSDVIFKNILKDIIRPYLANIDLIPDLTNREVSQWINLEIPITERVILFVDGDISATVSSNISGSQNIIEEYKLTKKNYFGYVWYEDEYDEKDIITQISMEL